MRFPRALAFLGEILDLRVERDGLRSTMHWGNRLHWLCAEPGRQRLWILPAPRASSRPLEELELDTHEAERLYRKWSDLEPIGGAVTRVRVAEPPEFRGRVSVIGYRSDKWSGDFEQYEHVFGSPPRLERAGEVYRISGGALRVTAGGIVG